MPVGSIARDCTNWAIVKIRAARLGFRVLVKTWKFEPYSLPGILYYSFHLIQDLLLPLVLPMLFMLSGIFGLPRKLPSEPGFQTLFQVMDLLSRIPWSRTLFAFIAAVILWLTFLRMGRFDRIMLLASRTPEAASFLHQEMTPGLRNTRIYSLLREIYASRLAELNRTLGLPDDRTFRFLNVDDGVSSPQPFQIFGAVAGGYAAIYAPLEETDLSALATAIPGADQFPALSRRIRRLTDGRQRFVQMIRWIKGGRRGLLEEVDMEGRPNFVVRGVRNDQGKLRLIMGTASYGDIMRTCDCLIEEITLLGTVLGETDISPRVALWVLPIRNAIWKQEGITTFVRPTLRRAGLGMAALTVLKEKDQGYEIPIGRRSMTVSTYMDTWHVIPAGMCNTRNVAIDREFLRTNIISEFFEELFNHRDLENYQGLNWKDSVNRRVHLMSKEAGLTDTDFDLLPTAVCIDLLNLRPEVCVVIAIHKYDFLEKFSDAKNNSLGWSIDEHNLEYEGSLTSPEAAKKLPAEESVQTGACAYHLGRKAMARFST